MITNGRSDSEVFTLEQIPINPFCPPSKCTQLQVSRKTSNKVRHK